MIAGRTGRPSAARGTKVSLWVEMPIAAMRAGETRCSKSRSAADAEFHQSSGFCSYQSGAGLANGIGLRPSATGRPCGVQAIALVADVLLSDAHSGAHG